MSSRITPPSADTGSGPGRRWTLVLAAVALVAIVGCLIYLLVARGGDDNAATPPPASEPTGVPSTPVEPSTTTSPSASASTKCSLPPGSQVVPNTPIHGAEWSLVNGFAVPADPEFGPQQRDKDGLRRCFAHSPTGAVYAVYNLIAALNLDDESAYPGVARRVMVPGPALEAHLRDFAQNPPSSSSDRQVEFGGFRVVDASANRATVLVGFSVGGAYLSTTWTVVWSGGDWKLRPPAAGEDPGDPATSVPDLTGFVPWRGA